MLSYTNPLCNLAGDPGLAPGLVPLNGIFRCNSFTSLQLNFQYLKELSCAGRGSRNLVLWLEARHTNTLYYTCGLKLKKRGSNEDLRFSISFVVLYPKSYISAEDIPFPLPSLASHFTIICLAMRCIFCCFKL